MRTLLALIVVACLSACSTGDRSPIAAGIAAAAVS